MRNATKQALSAIKREIDSLTSGDVESASKLFAMTAAIAANKQLASALSDRGASEDSKRALIERVFGASAGSAALRILTTASAQKWESTERFISAMQESAIRAVAQSTGEFEQLGKELGTFLEAISSNPELELSVGSRLGTVDAKQALVSRLFAGRLRNETLDILRSLLQVSDGRRIRRQVIWAREIVADQANRQVAVVTVAREMPAEQIDRVRAALATRFDRDITVSQVVDPAVIGGMRVEVADEVIDDTAAARLNNLRMQLA
ncbi:F0F1 ATP synthase subunit delta [Gulosibacter bifidus]|uniref:ATP synthase subunit delta n=1 Tax=Gulosibacter bifidus TaxID=272239 RepID=A0ABW5RJ55_9MICO|nr:F0F1 ATP synthase subunit delta [Gulosibacter bifidus]